QVSEDSSYVGLPLTINVTIECGKFTVIAFFNYCLSLIAYDLQKEQYCNSGNNSTQDQLHLCLPSVDSITIRDSKKSASQNKLNNLNKLSAKLKILFLIQAYHFICLSKQSIFPSTVIYITVR